MNKDALPAIEFGQRLVDTLDLDPLYVALWKAELPPDQLRRWLVTYWCYYHPGVCGIVSEIADSTEYWKGMMAIVEGGTHWPRGVERRHFRGRIAKRAIGYLRNRFPQGAGAVIDWLIEAGPKAGDVMRRVTELPGFGEWIKWKVPDMLERLAIAPIEFSEADLDDMFVTSKQGANLVAERYLGGGTLVDAHRYLLDGLGERLAPPRGERGLNVQETETVFCKWKSHLSGHYYIGKDVHDIRKALLRYAKTRTNQRLLQHLPTL